MYSKLYIFKTYSHIYNYSVPKAHAVTTPNQLYKCSSYHPNNTEAAPQFLVKL